jgi:hypothetical protein
MNKKFFILFFVFITFNLEAYTDTNTNSITLFEWFQEMGSIFSSIFNFDLSADYIPVPNRIQSSGGGSSGNTSLPPKPLPVLPPPIPFSSI